MYQNNIGDYVRTINPTSPKYFPASPKYTPLNPQPVEEPIDLTKYAMTGSIYARYPRLELRNCNLDDPIPINEYNPEYEESIRQSEDCDNDNRYALEVPVAYWPEHPVNVDSLPDNDVMKALIRDQFYYDVIPQFTHDPINNKNQNELEDLFDIVRTRLKKLTYGCMQCLQRWRKIKNFMEDHKYEFEVQQVGYFYYGRYITFLRLKNQEYEYFKKVAYELYGSSQFENRLYGGAFEKLNILRRSLTDPIFRIQKRIKVLVPEYDDPNLEVLNREELEDLFDIIRARLRGDRQTLETCMLLEVAAKNSNRFADAIYYSKQSEKLKRVIDDQLYHLQVIAKVLYRDTYYLTI